MSDNEKKDIRQDIEEPERIPEEKKETEQVGQTESAEKAEDEGPSLKEVIQEQAIEEEPPLSSTLTLRRILGGDILTTSTIRHQIWLFLLIAFFMILYTSNRYSCQQDLIEIDNLTKELQDAKYRALSSSSQITEKSRESNILQMLQNNKDSVLKIAKQPPYIINVPDQ